MAAIHAAPRTIGCVNCDPETLFATGLIDIATQKTRRFPPANTRPIPLRCVSNRTSRRIGLDFWECQVQSERPGTPKAVKCAAMSSETGSFSRTTNVISIRSFFYCRADGAVSAKESCSQTPLPCAFTLVFITEFRSRGVCISYRVLL